MDDDSEFQYTIDMSTMNSPSYSSVTINSSGTPSMYSTILGSPGSFLTTAGTNGTSWSTINTAPSAGLHVKSDAEFEGDIKWKGRSLGKLLEKIESRLAILEEPDPAKLEKYAALKKAYEHYKTLERLIGDD